MILGSGLTPAEQPVFDMLLKFFEGEDNAERKALALTVPVAIRSGFIFGEMTEEVLTDIVIGVIADFHDEPEVEYCFGERRDTRRDEAQCRGSDYR